MLFHKIGIISMFNYFVN